MNVRKDDNSFEEKSELKCSARMPSSLNVFQEQWIEQFFLISSKTWKEFSIFVDWLHRTYQKIEDSNLHIGRYIARNKAKLSASNFKRLLVGL